MAIKPNISTLTTYEPARSIEPIYTGGNVSANRAGSLLATSVDEDVLVVETATGKPLCRIEGDGEATTSLCLSPDALHLVVCSRSLAMRIYALTPEEDQTVTVDLLRTLKPHTTPVVTSAIDATGSLVATGGADGSVKVWDLRGGFSTHSFHPHGGVVSAVAFSRHDEASSILLASGAEDGKIRVHDLSTRKVLATLDSHVSVVRSLEFSSNEQRLLSSSRDRTIILWNTNSWKSERVILALEVLEGAGFCHDTSLVYAAGERGVPRIWSVKSGQELTAKSSANLETDAIVSVVNCPEESVLITIHQDQSLRFYSYSSLDPTTATPSGEELNLLRRITGSLDEVIDMACVGAHRSLLALATNTESIKLVSIADQPVEKAEGSAGASVESFGSDVGVLEGHTDIVICLTTDWSGNWLATGAKDNTARLWRLDVASQSFECVAVFEGHAESLGAVALPQAPPAGTVKAEDGLLKPPQFLLTGSQDKTVKKWDTSKISLTPGQGVQSGFRAAFTRVAHEKDINALDVSDSAPIFASASQDKTIKICSLEDGSVTGILRGHKRGVWSVKFSPAGAAPLNLAEGGTSSSRGLLVSGSGDRTVKVWSLSTYTCLLTFEGHSNSVLKVIWIPPPSSTKSTRTDSEQEGEGVEIDEPSTARNGLQNKPVIASASSDTLVKLWSPYASPDSDHLLTTLDNHTDRVWALATPQPPHSGSKKEGSSASRCPYPLISGAADATITFWQDTSKQTATQASQRANQRIEQDQLLQNHIHAKNYREAITLSLVLNHPGRLLRLFQDVIALPNQEAHDDGDKSSSSSSSITGSRQVDEVLATLAPEQVYSLLERVRDWNTNARTAPVAQRVLNCLLRSYPSSFFADLATTTTQGQGQGQGQFDKSTTNTINARRVRDLLRALEVYTDRHYKRVEELTDESYLLEYTLREMDDVEQ
ncbi:hypothetical protein DV735_g831, partial [Chaetothyriales sp. CBS 134920]